MTATKGFEPTLAQKNAINAHGGGITVSAAAGSGKTRVLVQRVIRLLTGDDPVPADRLLILTFTNTAAAEMKSRISKAIDDLISRYPENLFYRRQQLLLGSADICTIDSFCSRIVRDNFFRLGVNRDFRVGTNTELLEIRRRVMSDIIEEYYTAPDSSAENYEQKKQLSESFGILSMIMTDAKLDTDLENELLCAYDKYASHAFPDEWIDRCVAQYDPQLHGGDAGRIIMELLAPAVGRLRSLYDEAMQYRDELEQTRAVKQAAKKPKDMGKKNAYDTIADAYDSYGYFLEEIEDIFSGGGSIAGASGLISEFEKITVRYGATKDDTIKTAAAVLGEFADTVKKELFPCACFTQEVIDENNHRLFPVMKCLRSILIDFSERFFKAKKEKGILDFHDLESLVLKLLYEKTDSGYEITDFARETAAGYDEIMVDEYQDTNDIQENIFRAISRNEENLFVVGDIKQSIFRFREAKPVLFKKRCAAGTEYDEMEKHFPALIVLDRNFRSRSSIIDSVNYIFSLLMSEKAGDIEYDEKQRLTAGAQYPPSEGADVRLHMVEYVKKEQSDDDGEQPDKEDADKIKTEADYCAGLVRNMIISGEMVFDADEKRMRPMRYGDICILLRAVKNKAHIYSASLERAGIPSYTDTEFDLLERYEIRAAIAYLKIIDNPLSDIDLTAALMCPVSGFTPDEMAEIKSVSGRSFYKKLIFLSSDKAEKSPLTEKVGNFMKQLRLFRSLAVTMPADRLLWEFFETTAFVSVMRAMPEGEFRAENLKRLMNYISEYENSTGGGLTGFVRHIRYLEETGSGIRVADTAPMNAVRIMTIHHSKGLEFPVCILAASNSRGLDDHPRVNYHSELGIGLRDVDTEKLLQFNTVQYTAIQSLSRAEEKSELMRLLYVALTRPKEKLIVLSTVTVKEGSDPSKPDGYRKYLNDLARRISFEPDTGRISPSAVMGCITFSDWIFSCALLNGEMHELRRDAGIVGDSNGSFPGEEVVLPALSVGSPWKYVHAVGADTVYAAESSRSDALGGTGLAALMKKRFADTKTDYSTLIPSKVSASALAHRGKVTDFTAVTVPVFARKDRISPTQRGIATHNFLQYADLHKLYGEISASGDFAGERKRIEDERIMTAQETALIDSRSIISFVKSSLFSRMLNSVRLYREYRFTVNIPARMAAPGLIPEGEDDGGATSVLQGAVDCIIEEDDGLVIVDYKTDRVSDVQELVKSYGTQLELYREAAGKLFGKPVKECIIYSLAANRSCVCSTSGSL